MEGQIQRRKQELKYSIQCKSPFRSKYSFPVERGGRHESLLHPRIHEFEMAYRRYGTVPDDTYPWADAVMTDMSGAVVAVQGVRTVLTETGEAYTCRWIASLSSGYESGWGAHIHTK